MRVRARVRVMARVRVRVGVRFGVRRQRAAPRRMRVLVSRAAAARVPPG